MVDFVRQCAYCQHYEGAQVCPAFPAGIPNAVYGGAISHRTPLSGDGGVHFAPVHLVAKGYAAMLPVDLTNLKNRGTL